MYVYSRGKSKLNTARLTKAFEENKQSAPAGDSISETARGQMWRMQDQELGTTIALAINLQRCKTNLTNASQEIDRNSYPARKISEMARGQILVYCH